MKKIHLFLLPALVFLSFTAEPAKSFQNPGKLSKMLSSLDYPPMTTEEFNENVRKLQNGEYFAGHVDSLDHDIVVRNDHAFSYLEWHDYDPNTIYLIENDSLANSVQTRTFDLDGKLSAHTIGRVSVLGKYGWGISAKEIGKKFLLPKELY